MPTVFRGQLTFKNLFQDSGVALNWSNRLWSAGSCATCLVLSCSPAQSLGEVAAGQPKTRRRRRRPRSPTADSRLFLACARHGGPHRDIGCEWRTGWTQGQVSLEDLRPPLEQPPSPPRPPAHPTPHHSEQLIRPCLCDWSVGESTLLCQGLRTTRALSQKDPACRPT